MKEGNDSKRPEWWAVYYFTCANMTFLMGLGGFRHRSILMFGEGGRILMSDVGGHFHDCILDGLDNGLQ